MFNLIFKKKDSQRQQRHEPPSSRRPRKPIRKFKLKLRGKVYLKFISIALIEYLNYSK